MIVSAEIRNLQKRLNDTHEGPETRCEPGFLYHGTLLKNLPSIMTLGLGAKQPKNWKRSKDGVVCLAVTWDLADSYTAEYQECLLDRSDEKIFNHCILKVDCLDLPLQVDENESHKWLGGPISYQFRGIIPPDKIEIDRIRIYSSKYVVDLKHPLYEVLSESFIRFQF